MAVVTNPQAERNPGLDVLRAATIGGVLATHLSTGYAADWAKPFFGIGTYGVDLFSC